MSAGNIVIVGGDARLIVSVKPLGLEDVEVVLSNGDSWALYQMSGLARQLNDNSAKSWPLVTWFIL